MSSQSLANLVAARLELSWPTFRAEHPHLADAVERSVLVERAVADLADNDDYRSAMAQAHLDEQTLIAAAEVLSIIDLAARKTLGL